MALGQIDFSPLRRAGAAGMEVAKSYDPIGSFTKGALKGIELGQSFQKMKMEGQELEMKKEDHKRRGTLNDLLITEAQGKIKKLDAELEDLPAKREHDEKMQKLDLSRAETEVERQRIMLEEAKLKSKKAAEDLGKLPDMTARKYEEAGGLSERLYKSISSAPDEETRRLLVDRANTLIRGHETLSILYPDPISADENSMELLRHNADLFNEQAEMMTKKSTWIDDTTGDKMGFDKDGNPRVVMTKDQLDSKVYRPTAVPAGDKSVKDNRRAVAATMNKLQKASGIDYEIPGLSDREIQDRVTSQYLGILKERHRLNAPEATMEELVDEAFDLAFPESQFTVVDIGDGRKKATFNPQAPIATGRISRDGKSIDVNFMGRDNKGNYIFTDRQGGKLSLNQQQYDSMFVQGE